MSSQDATAIIQQVIQAANSGNIEGMMRFFSQDAVLRLEPPLPPPMRSTYRGRQEIREYLQQIVGKGFHVEAREFRPANNGVTWRSRVSSEAFQRLGVSTAEDTNHAVVRGGQIQELTIHYSQETLQRMQAIPAGVGRR